MQGFPTAAWPWGLWLASQNMIRTALQAAVYCRGAEPCGTDPTAGAPWKEEIFTRFNQSNPETTNEPSRVGGGNSSRLEAVEIESSRPQSRAVLGSSPEPCRL